MADGLCLIIANQNSISAGHFTDLDWLIVIGYLVFTTLLGGMLAGKQATIRDFFLGGRKLPWAAVAGSIIATEISAVTFVGVPAIVFSRGGNFTYLQLCLIGTVLARFIVAYYLVPAYYRQEIYSPYDYMAERLGGRVRSMTTALFTLGGLLAQGARVYLTAMILDLIVGPSMFGHLAELTGTQTMTWCVFAIGLIAIAWTLLGGITTVIWTDVLLFILFLFGGFIALAYVVAELPGSFAHNVKTIWDMGLQANESGPWGKFTLFDFSTDPAKPYTIWTAAIAYTIWCVGVYGTDQMMAQRVFCCRGAVQARKAVLFSCLGQFISIVMMLVGVGLYVYYHHFPLEADAAALVAEKTDRIFPLFIIQVLPQGVTGLLIAGIFAAAISSMDSILAALSQTTLSAFYLPLRRRTEGADEETEARRIVRISRILVVFWGVILCLMAFVADAASGKYPAILNLALSMAGYTGGALLAGFLLAFLPLQIDGKGFLYSAPLSVLAVFAVAWHEPWARTICWIGAIVLLAIWSIANLRERVTLWMTLRQTLYLLVGLGAMLYLSHHGYWMDLASEASPKIITLAWPWYVPIGFSVAYVFGYLLAGQSTGADNSWSKRLRP
ncbi:MAG: sodium/solute symporter [Phycisphaerales bacterium]|nr:sodium/solute symporter [Phycisphaerales bacterium]